jgi:thymidylate synthase (FAD)
MMMKVELISYSQQPTGCRCEGSTLQDIVAYCARVSNPSNQSNTETTEKLIRYLIKHKHWSPFEMVNVCLEITTTRDIARQILRHRSFSFQEFSQRYADPTKELDLVPREARMQDHKNRQNSVDITPFDGDRGMQLKDDWHDAQMRIAVDVLRTYNWAIENGIAKEQARAILPEGLTESRLYMNGTLRSWIHYIELRSGNGTQKEHREVAVACANAITPIFPLITEFVQ